MSIGTDKNRIEGLLRYCSNITVLNVLIKV
jgi:hypothetical protein